MTSSVINENLISLSAASYLEMEDNSVINQNANSGSYSMFNLSNSKASFLCCNSFEGLGNNLYLLGTNPITEIRNSSFTNGKTIFDNTMIGVNEHAGNKWFGSSLGRLIGSNAIDNQFEVNYSENNIKPDIIEPIFGANDWFKNDDSKNSNECVPKCGSERYRPINTEDFLTFPDSIQDLGQCYPIDLDRDNDGICDSYDPDPDDSCNPNMIDTDHDGICDPIDPDPTDGCSPIYRDTDRDGVCDTSDPDPFDPCVPNGIDTDGDGICDGFDPDPVNPVINDPVTITNCWWDYGINGYQLESYGYHNYGLSYKITDLEWLAQYNYGNETGGYGSLHYVESMEFLFEILHTSPYYRLLSTILNNKYIEICETYSSIPHYVKLSNDIRLMKKASKNLSDGLFLNRIYLNRLKNISQKLNESNPNDSLLITNLSVVIEHKMLENALVLDNINAEIEQKKTTIISNIEALPEDFPIYNALKDFYKIFSTFELQNIPLTSVDIETLNGIANLCPLIYGEAVHQARAMLVSEEISSYTDFNDDCINTVWNSKEQKNVIEKTDVRIYPNPTSDVVEIFSERLIESVEIYNIKGDLIRSIMFTNNKQGIIDLSDLDPSLYFVSISSNLGQKSYYKIIKI